MAIVKRPAGEATLYSQAAAITGKAIAAQRTLEAAKEQHREARRMEAEERAHQWEVEKMDMRSRMDFAEQEGRRQEKRAHLQAAIKRIDEIDTIPDSTKEKLKTKAILEFHQVSLSDRALGLIPERDDVGGSALDLFRARMGEQTVPTAEQLRMQSGPEAYKQGVELGYWSE